MSSAEQHPDPVGPIGPVDPSPEYPSCELGGTTELRIHGVSGTPVESMLHHPHPVQHSGYGHAGFFRRGDDHALSHDVLPPGRNLEAYSWGGLTSGSSQRALWLLLVPFTLANVASWVHPVRPRTPFWPIGLMSNLVRLFALSLTVTFMLATANVGMDLIGWQCANAADVCGSKHFYVRFLAGWGPGVRIAVGALLPLLVLALLEYLSHSTAKAYEDYAPDDADRVAVAGSSGADDLGNRNFWHGGGPFRRLRAVHACAALSTIAWLVSYAARQHSTGPALWLGSALPWVAGAFLAFCAVIVFSPWAGRRRDLLDDKPPHPVVRVAMTSSHWAGRVLVLVSLAYALWWGGPGESKALTGAMPGINDAVKVLYTIQIGLIVAYFVAAAIARLASPSTGKQALAGRMLFRSFGGPVLATLAQGIAGAYASGLVLRVADLVGKPVLPCTGTACTYGPGELVVAPGYFYAARTFVVVVVAIVPVVIGTAYWYWRRSRRCRGTVEREYGITPGQQRARVERIAKAQASSAVTDRADAIVAVLLVLTVAGQFALYRSDQHSDFMRGLTSAGTWLTGAFAVGMVALGRMAYGSAASRRTVGILWDLGTFWPRAAHPFAPPCYCERVVPEFARRVQRLTANGKVVISAHSQGSIIAAAAIHWLGPEQSKNVGLVTYGCPLDRLYARLFPHFFGTDALHAARANVGHRWRNLYRRTDPIGGPVFRLDVEGFTCGVAPAAPVTDPVDVKLLDPEFSIPEGEFVAPDPRAHSDYFHDAKFPATVTAVANAIPDPPTADAP